MISTTEDLLDTLARISEFGGDSIDIEAKTMSEYSAAALGPTISSFANLPGGGTIILGIDERLENPIVGVKNPQDFAQRAVDQGRKGFSIALNLTPSIISINGLHVVCINVEEVRSNDKPVRFKAKSTAYIRQFDGDFAMSPQEEQQLLLRHERPRNEVIVVPNTSIADLNHELLEQFLQNVRLETNTFTHSSDEDILLNLNIVSSTGELTRAGLYSLGTYPQRFFPTLSLSAAIEPRSGDSDIRAYQRKDFNGPIPRILDDATQWVIDNTPTAMTVDGIGSGGVRYTFPPEAIREAIANALVHRDLSDPALGQAVSLRLNEQGLRITNPGGLWGLSIDTLRSGRGQSAVNEHLYTICRYIHGTRGRVIEGLGSGIAAMQRTVKKADLQEPQFFDNGVRFTVSFARSVNHSPAEAMWLSQFQAITLNQNQRQALLDMRQGVSFSNASYRQRFGIDSALARSELRALVGAGYVTRTGERKGTRYSLSDDYLDDVTDSGLH